MKSARSFGNLNKYPFREKETYQPKSRPNTTTSRGSQDSSYTKHEDFNSSSYLVSHGKAWHINLTHKTHMTDWHRQVGQSRLYKLFTGKQQLSWSALVKVTDKAN